MEKPLDMKESYTKQEELANFISHLLGGLLAVVALGLMVLYSDRYGETIHIVCTTIYGGSLVALYSTSSIAHILPHGKAKELFFNLDRIAIYVLIAGTYTPLSLIALAGTNGWIVFGIEWALALSGILLILWRPGKFKSGVSGYYIFSYAFMGWLIIFAIVPLIRNLPLPGIAWIMAGGFCYSLGILFYKVWHFPFHHLVWHLLVLAGSICHFFAIFIYVIPR